MVDQACEDPDIAALGHWGLFEGRMEFSFVLK